MRAVGNVVALGHMGADHTTEKDEGLFGIAHPLRAPRDGCGTATAASRLREAVVTRLTGV